jgi:peroxiredoxin
MKSVIITVLISLALVSCKQTTVPENTDPVKFENVSEIIGLHDNVSLLSSPVDGFLSSGDLAPDFLIETDDNLEFSLSDLRGKVIYIEFWRTRCSFCVQSMPGMVNTTQSIEDEDFVVIAVSTDKMDRVGKSSVSNFIDNYSMNEFINIYDGTSSNSSIAYQYGIRGTPTGYLIDKEGRVVKSLHPASSSFKQSIETELDK